MGRLSRGANLASRPLPLENREGFVEGTAPALLSSPLKFLLYLENSLPMVFFSYTSAFVYTLPFIANRRLIKDEIKYVPIEKGFVQWYERKGISDGIIRNERDFILVTSHRCKEQTLLELLDIYGRGRWCMKT